MVSFEKVSYVNRLVKKKKELHLLAAHDTGISLDIHTPSM